MLTLEEVKKLATAQTENRKLCKVCGHSRLLGNQDRVICNHCGHWIFKDEETEKKYRIMEKINKLRRENSK